MRSFLEQREAMVRRQLTSRGVRDARVLAAMGSVPREQFVSAALHEFAYEDAPLPIEEGQTISQPYIVALMIEAAEIGPGDRVLEVGAGSGYATAVLSRVAGTVYAIEWHERLTQLARRRIDSLGYDNVHIRCGDGTLGWPEHAPFDAIIVSAGGPEAPRTLTQQLAIGGRLIVPVGDEPRTQNLMRIRRTAEHQFERDELGRVQFVPLVGSEGWAADGLPVAAHRAARPLRVRPSGRERLSNLIADSAATFDDLDQVPLDDLLARIGDARVVLIGEATHGTSEFYRMRARITRELIARRGFTIVALEADWPDAAVVDRHVRPRASGRVPPLRERPFSRFPTWMWRNRETRRFIDWLAEHNSAIGEPSRRCSVHGLDLYSLNNSIGAVLAYLERVDSETAAAARVRYGCFSPWETDPATYGRAAVSGRLRDCEREAVSILTGLLARRLEYMTSDGEAFFDAQRNATVVRNAERYYRAMYYGSRESWNLRDQHMFDTLDAALEHRGEHARAVVWAHNSHVGDAAATEMGTRGEINLGQLARERHGLQAYIIGFGTDHGTVAAASNWDEPMQVMNVRPSHIDSYERLCHDSGMPAFLLHLREPDRAAVRQELLPPHLERAIGVIYRPKTEMLSHYFQASLPAQFDEYIWFDQTTAVQPLKTHEVHGVPETYPFGL
jgi:protein-L-isoaspartate(D-aspartate) O-methyltransferase